MPRLFTFTPAANAAVKTMKNGPTRSMINYLLNTHGVGNEVDQSTLIMDLMRKQFVPLSEGGVFAKVGPISIANQWNLRKPEFIRQGYCTDRVTAKVKPVAKKVTIEALNAKIAELEAKLVKLA